MNLIEITKLEIIANDLFKGSKPIDGNVALALELALIKSYKKEPTLNFLKDI
jgi:hypothetical protein